MGAGSCLQNKENGFNEITKTVGLEKYSGCWNCVIATDIDKDGDVDIIAGNFGTNTKYKHPSKNLRHSLLLILVRMEHFNWLKRSLGRSVTPCSWTELFNNYAAFIKKGANLSSFAAKRLKFIPLRPLINLRA